MLRFGTWRDRVLNQYSLQVRKPSNSCHLQHVYTTFFMHFGRVNLNSSNIVLFNFKIKSPSPIFSFDRNR